MSAATLLTIIEDCQQRKQRWQQDFGKALSPASWTAQLERHAWAKLEQIERQRQAE